MTMDTPLTISSLLNSLHTHLQTQTQLLPTLHAQLGLPQSALTDELSALHHQLADCVERQIDGRRQEVEVWMAKCDNVEKDCIRLGRALGTHVKALGASVGELRKQQVLPVRYEMLTQYQEKLDKLYIMKLEQLSHLTNRITALTRTLGPDFYPTDILEHTCALADAEEDVLGRRDVTPERFSKLEKELVRGKAEITRRLTQLSAMMMQMDSFYDQLEIEPPSPDEHEQDLVASSSLALPSTQRGNSTSSPSDPFLSSSMLGISTPTPASRKSHFTNLLTASSAPMRDPNSSYHRIFAVFVMRIDEAETSGVSLSPGSLIGVEGVEPTMGLMTWAAQTLASLEEVKKRRESAIQAMYDQLETLWHRFNIEPEQMDAFVEHNRGSTEGNVRAYEEELERMLELKRERMSVFVESAREEIRSLWDELMIGDDERADFAPFADEEHTEELLTIHENEIQRLKDERRVKAPLLASIKRYYEICEEEKELAAAASDQTRLLGRGPRDPGRLLREEKMRKRVGKEKPRLENDLLSAIPAWEEEHGSTFLVNGVRIVDTLLETVGAADKENARKNKPRAGSVPPRSTTPSNSNGHSGAAPRSTSGTVTPAVRPGSSMSTTHSQSVPNKRPRLGTATGRTPFGDAQANINSTTLSSSSHPQKAKKTPIGSVRRPTVGKPQVQQPVSTGAKSRIGTGASYGPSGIGLGYATSFREQQQNRISTSASFASSTSTLTDAVALKVRSATSTIGDGKRTARRKRESFKPRPSADGSGRWPGSEGIGGRWAGFAGAVQEEDEC